MTGSTDLHSEAGLADIQILITRLHETEKQLALLTGNEVDSVADIEGRPFLMRRTQEHLRLSEAAKQAAIVDALPAHIVLLDSNGTIVLDNKAWRVFAMNNSLDQHRCGAGHSYLDACLHAYGNEAADGIKMAAGIQAVLTGNLPAFSMEYPCHSPDEQRWFVATVTPLSTEVPSAVVIMHVNITERKLQEMRFRTLSRVHAVMSSINNLIVHGHDSEEVFREACRIAHTVGLFQLAWIGTVEPLTGQLLSIASAGTDTSLLASLKHQGGLVQPASMESDALQSVLETHAIDIRHGLLSQMPNTGEHCEPIVASLAMFPLVVDGILRGVLALYADDAALFRDQELELLSEMAINIAFAIGHFEKAAELAFVTNNDLLTGLAKRNLFESRLAALITSAAAGDSQFVVGVIDLDRFKNLNDTLGRAAGDALLRQVAQWLIQRAGNREYLARMDADRFLALLPEVTNVEQALSKVQQSMNMLLSHSFQLNEASFEISAKVGLAVFPQDGRDAETLIKHAELALKQAKTSSDNCVRYMPRMTQAMSGRLELERRLRQALQRGEFALHYQPKTHLASGRMGSAEALIRWNDPITGLVPPSTFIPLLEQTGLIHAVGRWAIQTAITDARRWRLAGLGSVKLAVNVSPLQLKSLGFAQLIAECLDGDVLAAAGLELEITESLAIENIKTSIPLLKAIREMGVSIALDDFGTGFSSLSYLSRLPIDRLKIDRSFIIEMTSGPHDLALVSSIINLAHALQIKVVAEGVETEEQARLLRLLGCDEMQGFLISKALPTDLFESQFLLQTPARH